MQLSLYRTRGRVDGVLPVAVVSGSLPWRSDSSHWYKATGELHAKKKKHGVKKMRSNVKRKAHTITL